MIRRCDLALQRLKRIADGTASAEDVQRHAESIARYLDGGISFEETIGLVPHWWQDTQDAQRSRRSRRDDALRSYAEYVTGSAWSRACSVANDLRRYESGLWLRDRDRAEMPAGYAGTPREHLFAACRAHASDGSGNMPNSPKQIARILSHCKD